MSDGPQSLSDVFPDIAKRVVKNVKHRTAEA